DWALRERAGALIELGRFAEALAALRGLPPDARRRLDGGERAAFHTDLALCLDRLGGPAEADAEVRPPARLDPEAFPVPLPPSSPRPSTASRAAFAASSTRWW